MTSSMASLTFVIRANRDFRIAIHRWSSRDSNGTSGGGSTGGCRGVFGHSIALAPPRFFIRYTIPREMSSIIPAALVNLQNGLGKAPVDFSCFHPPFPQTVPRQIAGPAVDKDSRTRGIAA